MIGLSAACAEASSGRTVTATFPKPVPVGVVRLSVVNVEPQPVYDLTVEGVPEFYANGLLVHNCVHVLSHLADLSLDSGIAAPLPAALPKPSIGGAARRGGMNLGGFGRPAGR